MQSDRSLEQAEKVLRREVSSNGQLRSTRAGKLAQARIHDAKAPARAAARSSQPLSSAGRQDMTLAEGAGAPNVLVDARYRAIESVIPRVIPVSATLSCTGGHTKNTFPEIWGPEARTT